MAFPSQQQIDVIATQILLDTKQALLELQGWNNSIKDGAIKMKLFQKLIEETAKKMGGDFKSATAAVARFSSVLGVSPVAVRKLGKSLTDLDKIAQKSLGGVSQGSASASARITLLGNAIQSMAARSKMSIDQVVASLRTLNASTGTKFGKLGFSDVEITKAGNAAKQTGAQLTQAGQAGQKAGHTMESAFKRAISPINALRIALGAIVAMIVFRVIQAVEQFFTQAIEQAQKFEDTLYRIANAERALSMEGVEVTLKGLKQGIIDIQKLLPIFSKEDIASLVGTLAVSTKQLKLNEQQILDLAKAIGILNIRSEKQEDIQTTAQHVLSSLLTGNAKGISALGIAFTDNTMKAEAMKQGFIEADEAVSDLTENEKGLVKLALLMQSTGQELEGIGEYMDSNSAKIQQNKAAWNDLLTTVGQVILPFIPALTTFFELIANGFQAGKVLIIEFITILGTLGVVMAGVFTGQINSIKEFTDLVANSIDTFRTAATNKLFLDVPENAPDWFMKGWGNRIKEDAETATSALNGMYDAAEENEEALKALEDLDQKIQDIMLDAKQAQEDLDLRLEQKQADLDTEYERKAEDAAIDHAQKLQDINQDALDKIEDAKAKSREEEKKAEQDLLQKLKELRQRFLLDLEDALHARDARAVLRLIKEYKLEKQNLLDRKKLDDQQRKDKLAEDLRAIEIERQRRIQQEKVEYQRRLADLAQAKAREREELALWYKREQDDIQRNIEQKIQKLLAGYIAEKKIHESQQAEISAILAKYIGYDMEMVNRLAQFMATRFSQMSGMMAQPGSLNYSLNNSGETNPFAGKYADPTTGTKGGRKMVPMADGGTLVANRPTAVMFGEKGPEAATFTPLGRTGKDVNKVFGDLSGAGMNGTIVVAVDLSPDLEGRVVQRSMEGVGQVISRVNNRKV
jgi:hypothetical protein